MAKKTILFDLDGTLTDPALGITKSVAYALEHYGIHVENLEDLLTYIGPPLTESFECYHGFSPEDAKEAVKVYREYFSVTGLFENEVYPGIDGMLDALCAAGVTLAVATSKPTVFARRILEHFDLEKYFAGIYGSELNLSRMNKADVIAWALEDLGITDPSQSCLMVGDREHDVLGAKPFGIPTVGVRFGYAHPGELEKSGVFRIAEDPDELRIILMEWAIS